MGQLVVTPQGQARRVELRGNGAVQLAAPAEGLWSIAMGWTNNWPADWAHGSPGTVERKGPWLVLSGQVKTVRGYWRLRDAYIAEGQRLRCIRRWEWTGNEPAGPVTLSVRWQAPAPGAAVMMPAFCYYGNPSGGADRVAKFSGKPGEELFCEEHRLAMPFVSLEWASGNQFRGAALHTLPSLAPFARQVDQWWSAGVIAREQFTELSLLSGPCSLNGQRGFVKANQTKWFPYADTFLTVPAGAIIEKTFYLQAYPVERQGAGFFVPERESLALFQPFSADGLPTVKEILEAKYRMAVSRWHEGGGSAGFRMYPSNNRYVMGWCGQAEAPGYAILGLPRRFASPEALRMAQRSLDHLATAPFDERGFFLEYSPEEAKWNGQDPVSQGEAMENFGRAILVGRKRSGVDTSRWETFLRRACDLHAARILEERWRPKSTAEAFFISPLCKAYQLFGGESYRAAALKAATHYARRHLDMTEPYWGGTLDASCEDKEGAWAAFQAFLAIYEMTKDPQHLRWAEHAMNVTLTYTVVWDISLPPGRLRDHDFKTRGWTVVSAQNQHLDVFGVLFTPDIYRMGQYLGRDDLKRLAIVMYRSCGQIIDPGGSQGEQFNHSNFAQLSPPITEASRMRGTYSESWTVFWITAHFLNAAAEFERAGVNLN